ncbi:Mob1/phocein [Naematelia encephala]|uniref:Mob1/phocein n=1 Tax=Naematelia encephala TaxID=71784 RepID=A0A1Y2B935_9TREE|nr:Mob1/phocein [Naematelia encephala]
MIINPPPDSGPSTYRLKRGTKLADYESVPNPLPPLSSLDGPFQLAEYLALKVRADPHDIKGLVEVPSGDTSLGGKAPEREVWIYEHLRRLPVDLTPLLINLLGTCSKETCPKMMAGEWLYLCVAHGDKDNSKEAEECCAIDYILHTVDSTVALLNNATNFPSRLQIPPSSLSHFPSLLRRLSRIFSHAFFHHREAFSLAEAETSLYARFLGLCDRYELVGPGLLVIPRDAIGPFTSDEEDEDDEEEEEVSSEESEGDQAERGRDKEEGENGGRRTKSLDRNHEISPTNRPRQPLLPKNEPLPLHVEGQVDPPVTVQRSGTIMAKGTLGRGKQSRGTMLWTSDDAPPLPLPERDPNGLTRSESIESIVRVEPTEIPAGIEESVSTSSTEPPIPVPDVPKDEIELLEEQGAISPATSVSPLKPPSAEEQSNQIQDPTQQTQDEGLEEVKLHDDDDIQSDKDRAVAGETPLIEEGSAEHVESEVVPDPVDKEITGLEGSSVTSDEH